MKDRHGTRGPTGGGLGDKDAMSHRRAPRADSQCIPEVEVHPHGQTVRLVRTHKIRSNHLRQQRLSKRLSVKLD